MDRVDELISKLRDGPISHDELFELKKLRKELLQKRGCKDENNHRDTG